MGKNEINTDTNGKRATDDNPMNASLQKRIKEQSCLYSIINLKQDLSIENLLSKASTILPEGWHTPEKTAVSLEFDGNKYATPNFEKKPHRMSAEREIRTGRPLTATIVHLEDNSTGDGNQFLKEEQALLDAVLNHLALRMDRILAKQEMKEKQQQLDKAYQLARIGSWEFDMHTHELSWSPVTKQVHGFGPEHKPDVEHTINLFKEGKHRDTFAQAAYDAIHHEKPFDVELKIISGQGDERWVRATGEPEYNDDGRCTHFYGISQNVTDRRQAEEELQLRERRFKSMVQDGSDLIVILDANANYQYVSPTSESVLGIPAEDFVGTNAFDYIHEDDRERIQNLLENLDANERINIPPYRFLDSEDNWRWIETTLTDMTEDPAVGGLVANSRDVTKQIRQQKKNQEALKEKETLLAEIHHRVKNNLAVVSGMMQLQASEEENKTIKDKLFDGIVRIKTMANIHEQLYQSNSFSRLEFAENIRSLTTNIHTTFQSKTDITIDFDCKPVKLNINQAIPCSLIVNEVLTNVFKHAFPDREKGHLMIQLSEHTNDNHIQLSITDNGIGLPQGVANGAGGSLGLSLIDVLSQQLEASYTYEATDNGTVFSIGFTKDEKNGIGNHYL